MASTDGPQYPGTSDGLIFSFDPKNRECWKGGATSTVYGLGSLNATGSMNFDSDAGELDGANTKEGYFTFDGASDYVPFESTISSNLTYVDSWSIGCWVYVTGNWNCAWSNVISGTRGVFVRETNGNAWEFWIYQDGSNYKTVTSNSFPQNQWVSAICTYGGAGNMNVYVNEKSADRIITSSLRNPLLPDNYIIEDIGIGDSFIESYKKKYKLKSHKTI